MAELVGCSLQTIQSIETGRMKLTNARAERITIRTGVNLGWLMDGDIAAPIIDDRGRQYTRATFEKRASSLHYAESSKTPNACAEARRLIKQMRCLLKTAHGKGKFMLCSYKIVRQLKAIQKELGLETT